RKFECLLRPEHAWASAEFILALAVVEACIAARAEKKEVIACANGERLGDASRLDPKRLCSRIDSGSALFGFDEAQVRRVLRQPGPHTPEAHLPVHRAR